MTAPDHGGHEAAEVIIASTSFVETISRLALALAVALGAYFLVYRPLQLRWGATDAEVARAMPGDDFVPRPVFDATRAVTVDEPAAAIWPWLVQIGYRRAGWYGLDWFDNDGRPSARRIVPELQQLRAGDTVPISPIASTRVAAMVPNRYLLTRGTDGTPWVWALFPVDASHTRLVWRMRSAPYLWTSWYLFPQLLTDAVDVIAVRANLLGIKERAEGQPPGNAALPYVELALWFVTFLGFLGAEVGLVRWRDWRPALLAAVIAALVTIAAVLVKPAVWVEALAAVAVWGGVWAARHLATASHSP